MNKLHIDKLHIDESNIDESNMDEWENKLIDTFLITTEEYYENIKEQLSLSKIESVITEEYDIEILDYFDDYIIDRIMDESDENNQYYLDYIDCNWDFDLENLIYMDILTFDMLENDKKVTKVYLRGKKYLCSEGVCSWIDRLE